MRNAEVHSADADCTAHLFCPPPARSLDIVNDVILLYVPPHESEIQFSFVHTDSREGAGRVLAALTAFIITSLSVNSAVARKQVQATDDTRMVVCMDNTRGPVDVTVHKPEHMVLFQTAANVYFKGNRWKV